MMTNALRNSLPVRHIKSDFASDANAAEMHEFSPTLLAQNGASESASQSARQADARYHVVGELGDALSIREVAALLGCSAWTVRQRYLPQGLPHLRACSGGRIVFFREQVVAWILKRQQQKGGPRK